MTAPTSPLEVRRELVDALQIEVNGLLKMEKGSDCLSFCRRTRCHEGNLPDSLSGHRSRAMQGDRPNFMDER